MTEDELMRVESRYRGGQHGNTSAITRERSDVLVLAAEVRRLKGLVKDACSPKPWQHPDCNGVCPWCNGDQTLLPTHSNDCPAFTPNGDVR